MVTDLGEDPGWLDPEADAEMSDPGEDSEMSDAEDDISPRPPTLALLGQLALPPSGFEASPGRVTTFIQGEQLIICRPIQ